MAGIYIDAQFVHIERSWFRVDFRKLILSSKRYFMLDILINLNIFKNQIPWNYI